MRTSRSVGYLLLLLVAFVVGLFGTIAASRTLAASALDSLPALEQPAQAPIGAPESTAIPTIEC